MAEHNKKPQGKPSPEKKVKEAHAAYPKADQVVLTEAQSFALSKKMYGRALKKLAE